MPSQLYTTIDDVQMQPAHFFPNTAFVFSLRLTFRKSYTRLQMWTGLTLTGLTLTGFMGNAEREVSLISTR